MDAANPLRPGIWIVTSWCWRNLWTKRYPKPWEPAWFLERATVIPIACDWQDVPLTLQQLQILRKFD